MTDRFLMLRGADPLADGVSRSRAPCAVDEAPGPVGDREHARLRGACLRFSFSGTGCDLPGRIGNPFNGGRSAAPQCVSSLVRLRLLAGPWVPVSFGHM